MKTIQCAHPPHHHNGFVANGFEKVLQKTLYFNESHF